MRISDWRSDVCSSDLAFALIAFYLTGQNGAIGPLIGTIAILILLDHFTCGSLIMLADIKGGGDRKSVVEGRSVSVRGDIGRRRLIQTNINNKHSLQTQDSIANNIIMKILLESS